MKNNKILILAIIILNNICIVRAQTFEKDWQWLIFSETTASPASSVCENALFDLVTNNLKDTSKVSFYDCITTFIKDIIEDSSITSLDKRNTLDRILTSCYGTFPKKNKLDITIGILESDDCKFSWIQSLCNEASKHHDYYVFDVIETSKWFSNIEVEEKFEYYIYISTLLYKEDHQQSVDYLLKAINHAQESNREDLNFYHGPKMSEVYHNFYRVASESSDTCDIIKYSLMNISNIKRTYGIQSKEFLNAIMFPIKKGVLEERKARTSFISSSDNVINPQLQQLFQQYDTMSNLHERSLLLHNATQICIEQKMDSASFAECVYYAGVHWLGMGELSRGYNNIFQSIHLYSRHCKNFFSSMHDCERIARMANAYYAYGDKNTYRTDVSVNSRGVVTNPYSVGTNYFGNGDFYNNGIKTVYNKIKEINYTFKGYRSVDYDALNYSLLYLGCSYYNTYGFILEGGCNFTTAGIAMIYGDYKDGKYHSLIAEYTIDSKDGEALYNLARSFCSKGI